LSERKIWCACSTINDTGTDFDLRKTLTVVNDSGKTVISPLANPFMKPDELKLFKINGGWGWRGERTIAVHYTILVAAVKKISRWYDIEVVLQDQGLQDYLLTATIQNEKPEQTLRLISMALPVDYTTIVSRSGNEHKRVFYLKKR
jgi:hypothetical protein